MEEQCSICLSKFTKYRNAPLVICRQQHLICFICRVNLGKNYQEPKCPFCRVKIHSKDIFRNKLYDQCNEHVEELYYKYKMAQNSCDSEFFNVLNDLLAFQSNTDQKLQVDCLEHQMRRMLQSNNFIRAKIIIKRIIEEYPEKIHKEKSFGLGSRAELKFYGREFKNYWDRYYAHKSLFDKFAVCCLYESSYEDDKEWYEKMIAKHPSLYQAVFGLAVLEHNYGNKVEAQRLYEQVIEIEASCSKACEMLAFLHFPSSKSKQYAMESFAIKDRFNVFTDYFLAMCGQDDKPEKLRQIIENYPEYMLPRFQLCQFYRKNGNKQKIVASYLNYIEGSLNLYCLKDFFNLLHSGQAQIQLYEQTLPILLKIMDAFQGLYEKIDHEIIIGWICLCLAKTQNDNLAKQLMAQFWQDRFYPVEIVQIVINDCKSLQTKDIISIFQTKTKGVLGFKDLNLQTKLKLVASYVILGRDDRAFECVKNEVDQYDRNKLFEQIQNQKDERLERSLFVRFFSDQ